MRAKEHKKQHQIPQCYLNAWCDPGAKPQEEPYLWRFKKDEREGRRKAPRNIFYEKDAYTISSPDGGRNLVLEHGLHDLEDAFVYLRKHRITKRSELTTQERLILCAFIAAMHGRTKAMGAHWGKQWGRVNELVESMVAWNKTASAQQKRVAYERTTAHAAINDREKLNPEEIKDLATRPMSKMLPDIVNTETPLLYNLDLAFIVTDDAQGFITSDAPCVWYDPEWYKRPPLCQAPALMHDTIEITLPLTPSVAIFLNRKGANGYISIPGSLLDEFNRRTQLHSHEYFVSNACSAKEIWFDRGREPDDSWRKTHETPEPAHEPKQESAP